MKRIRVYKRPLAVAGMVLAISLLSVSGASAYQGDGGGSYAPECTASQQLQAHDSELCRPALGSFGDEYKGVAEEPSASGSGPIQVEWFVVGAAMGLAIAGAATVTSRRRHALS